MLKVTRFCVLPYDRQGRRGEALQFYTLDDAQAAALRMQKRCSRVDVYSVTGWPVQDLWDRPRKVGGSAIGREL